MRKRPDDDGVEKSRKSVEFNAIPAGNSTEPLEVR
jgi:hypothetical protein